MPECNINKNIIITQEVAQTMRKKRGHKSMVIKIDLHKAYYRLCWEFIEDTLNDLGFPAKFAYLIMICISFVFMYVLWNGAP